MNIIDIGNTLLAIARDPAWGAVGTLTAQGAAIVVDYIVYTASLPRFCRQSASGGYLHYGAGAR